MAGSENSSSQPSLATQTIPSQPAPRKRIGFRKSRNGCLRCKKRKVKAGYYSFPLTEPRSFVATSSEAPLITVDQCDEKVPCTSCVRHRIPCSLENAASFKPPESACSSKSNGAKTCTPSQSPLSHGGVPVPASSGGTALASFPFLSADAADTPECWLSNAELILHYTNVTCHSIPPGHAMTTYQVDIPREGLAQPYLMRMIMSLSSFHLAYLNKDKRAHYLLLANKHQILAVRGLRGALARAVTPQNCHALWLSSIFLAISKFAFTPTCEHYQGSCSSALLNLVNIFSMISGMVAIMRSSQELIRTGPFQGIFSQRLGFQYSRSDLRDLLQSVSDLDKTVKSWGLDPDPNVQLALTSALESLDSCVADISNSPDYGSFPAEIKILFVWPSRLSQTFLDLIKASHPLAVIVLAHYCCLIRWSGPAYWFCRGWGRPLADCVMSILEDSEWEHLAEWPMKVMVSEDK